MTAILGISAFYHNSAAALLIDGEVVAAAQEERFTRLKNDSSFPAHAIAYVLAEAGIEGCEVSYVAFYEKPFIKFERLLDTYHTFAPRGFRSFLKAIPVWIKDKLYIKRNLQRQLATYGVQAPVLFPEHHLSHAAAAFYPSPFEKAAILTVDGVGEWTTTAIGQGNGQDIRFLKSLRFPHSLGLLYSAFTYYCGFKVNSDEYKLMGLAPYGNAAEAQPYIDLIKRNLIDIKADGSFTLNMRYFEYATGLRMTRNRRWEKLFGVPPRQPESEIRSEYIQMAYAIQQVTEEVILRLARTARLLTGCDKLVLAGGVALNCVANGKLRDSHIFDELWIQPAADDAGGALGAAYAVWHIYMKKKRSVCAAADSMKGGYLGPSFTDKDIRALIRRTQVQAEQLPRTELSSRVAKLISEGAIVGWFQGRMEFGPRALGNRSILADPRNEDMQRKLNMEIKYRESFRPFAPSVLAEDADDYFCLQGASSPYMLQVAQVQPRWLSQEWPQDYTAWPYMRKLYHHRSQLQAITHVDCSARVQTVTATSNPVYYDLLTHFKALTGCGVLVNTSFNVRGEPIVCTPSDAYRCFMHTGMDYLVIEDWLFSKPVRDGEIDKQTQ